MAARNYDGYWLASEPERMRRLRLFLAGNNVTTVRDGIPALYASYLDVDAGVTNRLLSFAAVDDLQAGAFEYYVEGRQDPMKVFVAAAVGSSVDRENSEAGVADAGADRRLLSFNELANPAGGSGPQCFTFWIEERLRAMRLFVAGNVKSAVGGDPNADDAASGVTDRLLTFADIDDWAKEAFAFWVAGRPAGVSVFLDSGAFGAYMRGATIDLGRYCDYIHEHRDALFCYAALDVIGDWQGTRRNVDEMVRRGLDPIPTFHRGSPWHVLDRLASEHKYIAIGGLAADTSKPGARANTGRDNVQPFMDELFGRLERHWPVKVHAFGLIAQWALERYPLYSADSSTAIVGAGMGRVNRFEGGSMRSRQWTEDAPVTFDGAIVDTVGAKKSAHAGRRRRNIGAILALENYATQLWKAKGVEWTD